MSNIVQTSSLEGFLNSGDSIRIQPTGWLTKYYTCTQDKKHSEIKEKPQQWECMRGYLESFTGSEPTKNLPMEYKIVPISIFTFNKEAAIAKQLEGPVVFPFEK